MHEFLNRGMDMREMSQIRKKSNSQKYLDGEWHSASIRAENAIDEATITFNDGTEHRFKVKNYSKGEKGWKIIEDSDA